MKKILIFFVCIGFLITSAFSSPQGEYYSYSYARLSYVNGDVYIQRAGDQGFEEGVVNLVLIEGDKLGTREGRAEIHFGRKNYLRINHDTQVDLISLPERGNDSIKLHLLSGEIYLRVNYLEREKDLEIHTPDASFYILEEGLYYVNVSENRETKFTVHQGTAEAAGEEDSQLIRSQERVVATDGYIQSDPVSSYGYYEDSFADWNRSRDAQYSRVSTQRYLPEELYEYEAELADNGRWVYERPYGYVWIPTVYHYHDWRPYHYGRWAWYPIIGWNWVSYEPWGWSVYHYGRWHWGIGLGWYWIPTRYWGPSWVHWYSGHDYIGWCPLSYHGYPVVVVNNRFYGHHYDRYYPLHSRALTVVHRNQLQARRISKVALSRNQITRLGKISLSAKQPGIKPVRNADRMMTAAAKKALTRSSLRQVNKGFKSGRASPISRSSGSISSNSVGKKTLSNSTSISRTPERRSSLSGTVSKTSRGSFVGVERSDRSPSSLKTYPSRRSVSSFSKSQSLPSSSLKGTSRSSTREVRRESSVKNYSSRSLLGSRSSSSSAKSVSRGLRSPSRGSKVTAGRVKSYPSSSRSFSRNSRGYSSNQLSRMTSKTYSRSSSSSGTSYYRSRSNVSSRGSVSQSSASAYRSKSSTGYVRQNSSYIRGGSSLSRGNSRSSPSLSRSRSRSSYSPSRSSYVSPSRSYSRVKSSSSRSSGSGGRISSSRSFSGGSKSISRSSARSSSSSRSRSSGSKVRKR